MRFLSKWIVKPALKPAWLFASSVLTDKSWFSIGHVETSVCITEGVQLLCLIDKGLDACRYLQTYGAWEQAVWLSKVSTEEQFISLLNTLNTMH